MSRRVFLKGGREGWVGNTRGIYVWKLSVLVLVWVVVTLGLWDCENFNLLPQRQRGFVNFGHAVNANKDKCSSTLQPPRPGWKMFVWRLLCAAYI